MNLLPGLPEATVTPAPDINTQVVNELKGTVDSARDVVGSFFQNLPVFLTRLVIAGAVLLREPFTWQGGVCCVLILLGIYGVQKMIADHCREIL